MRIKASKGQVEVNSTTLIIILGIIMAILVMLYFADSSSGFFGKSTGIVKMAKDCALCGQKEGFDGIFCNIACWFI